MGGKDHPGVEGAVDSREVLLQPLVLPRAVAPIVLAGQHDGVHTALVEGIPVHTVAVAGAIVPGQGA